MILPSSRHPFGHLGFLRVARPGRRRSPSYSLSEPIGASHNRIALSMIASNTGWVSVGELLMTFRISAVAVCCSRASFNSASRSLRLALRFFNSVSRFFSWASRSFSPALRFLSSALRFFSSALRFFSSASRSFSLRFSSAQGSLAFLLWLSLLLACEISPIHLP